MIKTSSFVLAVAFVIFSSHLTVAQTLFVPETFGDGGTPNANGWTVGSIGSVTADLGESGLGDHAIDYGTQTGFHFLHPSGGTTANPVFVGDYLSAGATAIRFNARHSGIGDSVFLRATFFKPLSGGVDWAQSNDPVVLTPNDTTWQTYELPLLPSDLNSGGDNGLSPADILADVGQLGIRHDPAGNGPTMAAFVSTDTHVYFDDVMLVPEPASAWLALLVGACAWVRRSSR